MSGDAMQWLLIMTDTVVLHRQHKREINITVTSDFTVLYGSFLPTCSDILQFVSILSEIDSCTELFVF